MFSSSDKTSALTSAQYETSRDRPSCTDEKLRTVSVLGLRFCCVRWYPLWRIFLQPTQENAAACTDRETGVRCNSRVSPAQ